MGVVQMRSGIGGYEGGGLRLAPLAVLLGYACVYFIPSLCLLPFLVNMRAIRRKDES